MIWKTIFILSYLFISAKSPEMLVHTGSTSKVLTHPRLKFRVIKRSFFNDCKVLKLEHESESEGCSFAL